MAGQPGSKIRLGNEMVEMVERTFRNLPAKWAMFGLDMASVLGSTTELLDGVLKSGTFCDMITTPNSGGGACARPSAAKSSVMGLRCLARMGNATSGTSPNTLLSCRSGTNVQRAAKPHALCCVHDAPELRLGLSQLTRT